MEMGTSGHNEDSQPAPPQLRDYYYFSDHAAILHTYIRSRSKPSLFFHGRTTFNDWLAASEAVKEQERVNFWPGPPFTGESRPMDGTYIRIPGCMIVGKNNIPCKKREENAVFFSCLLFFCSETTLSFDSSMNVK